jgi:hypothetical protein
MKQVYHHNLLKIEYTNSNIQDPGAVPLCDHDLVEVRSDTSGVSKS